MRVSVLGGIILYLIAGVASLAWGWWLYKWLERRAVENEFSEGKFKFAIMLFFLAWGAGSALIYWLLGLEIPEGDY